MILLFIYITDIMNCIVCSRNAKFVIETDNYCGIHYRIKYNLINNTNFKKLSDILDIITKNQDEEIKIKNNKLAVLNEVKEIKIKEKVIIKEEEVKEEVKEEEVNEEVKEEVIIKEEVIEEEKEIIIDDISQILLTISDNNRFKNKKKIENNLYLIIDTQTKIEYFLKINCNDLSIIYYEYNILKNFTKSNLIIKLLDIENCKSYFSNKNKNISYMITESCYDNLTNRLKVNNYKFTNNIIKMISMQLILFIKNLHTIDYLYGNFDPNNIMFKTNDLFDITMCNFEHCNKFLNMKGIHIDSKSVSKNYTNQIFASMRSNNLLNISRKDDMESIGYIMLYMYNYKLPWISTKSNKTLLTSKKKILLADIPDYIKNYLTEVDTYDYYDRPNYNKLINIINED